MAKRQTAEEKQRLEQLLERNHTLNGGILFGLDGYIIEMQARAMRVLHEPEPVTSVTRITGMAGGAVREAFDRIAGAFARFTIPPSEVEVLINLAPADLPKDGTWLDQP